MDTYSLPWGQLPSFELFRKHFHHHTEDSLYVIHTHNDTLGLEGTYEVEELYETLQKLCYAYSMGDEYIGDYTAAILSTLGFDWV